jgi:hypothetical protein
MNEATAKDPDTLTASPFAEAVVVVAVMQALIWLVSAALLDGGVVCGLYSRLLVAYWTTVSLLGVARVARGRSLGRMVAISGWLPAACCLLFMFRVVSA